MSTLVAPLIAEHEVIDQMLGSLRTYVQRRAREALGPADAQGFVDFFRVYAGDFHHAREEEVFLAALRERADLPSDHGPIAIMHAEHRELAELLDQLSSLLCSEALDDAGKRTLDELAVRYSHGLWHHIDAENTVIFPEGAERLRRSGLQELPLRAANAEEAAALSYAHTLLTRYPPLSDPSIFRGEGCVHCPAYGVRCDGLEREWWTEQEWEEFEERARQCD